MSSRALQHPCTVFFLLPFPNNNLKGADDDCSDRLLPVKQLKVTLLLLRRPFELLLWKSLSDVALTRSPETMD